MWSRQRVYFILKCTSFLPSFCIYIMLLLYDIVVLYIDFIYLIIFRINSKFLSSKEYRTTIKTTIDIIQIPHHPVLLYLYVLASYVKTMFPYFMTSLTQTHCLVSSQLIFNNRRVLDGWRFSSSKRVMSRQIQVRQLHTVSMDLRYLS